MKLKEPLQLKKTTFTITHKYAALAIAEYLFRENEGVPAFLSLEGNTLDDMDEDEISFVFESTLRQVGLGVLSA